MTWPVVIKYGSNLHQTLATVKFDLYGNKTDQEIFICYDWASGLEWAFGKGHKQVLFLNSGTIIKDWLKFRKLIAEYPHRGLIAHIIWRPDEQLYLDDQCWFMNIDQFELEDFGLSAVTHPIPVCSSQNLHDNYTPLWVKPTTGNIQYQTSHFGQGLIARQLINNLPIVNWNNSARDLKFYLYDVKLDLSLFSDYMDIAENQLWIFNNEPVLIIGKPRLVSPGSGLSWMLNIIDPCTIEMQIVDISRIQIKFCQTLWHSWNGEDYGTFVWNFIQDNRLTHYEMDNPQLSALERLKLKNKTKFIQYVNATFDNLIPNDFATKWQLVQQTKQVKFHNSSLISWVLYRDIDVYDHVWCSNILDYKWTLLHTTPAQYVLFQSKLEKK